VLAELLAEPGVTETAAHNGLVGVMAMHAGLEPATGEIAERVAHAAPASSYIVTQPHDLAWHVPSTHYDPRASDRLFRFLDHVRIAVSIHGFGRVDMDDTILLGGTNRRLAADLGAAIAAETSLRTIVDLDAIPAALRGLDPRNPVNLPEFGGVQLELSPGARSGTVRPRLIAAMAGVLAVEQRGLCVTG